MKLRYEGNVVPAQDTAAKIAALAWAPNSMKLAVCGADRVISLYDENNQKRDKFATKPVDAKNGKKSYAVRGLAFSPDSSKLAVGQTDNILFVYKIGDAWGEKKLICNKFAQSSAVTCVMWPDEQGVVLGTLQGKVRLCNVRTNRSSTLYTASAFVIALSPSPDKKALVSAHADGSIVTYSISKGTQQRLCQHGCAPYALAWTEHSVVAAGCDKRFVSYEPASGRLLQQFDYAREPSETAFNVAAVSPSANAVVIASFDRLRLFEWNSRRSAWDDSQMKYMQYLYSINTLAWKADASKIACGTLCGGVELFDCSLKRSMLNKMFETTFVSPSHVIIKHLSDERRAVLKSALGHEIVNVKVLGQERYAMVQTTDSVILADMQDGGCSEVSWTFSGNERFFFDFENAFLVFNAGELSVIEHNTDTVLAAVRTERMNPHVISVRVNQRPTLDQQSVKRMAYLLDANTISIIDLTFGTPLAQIDHDSKIDWLELNETGRKLLFRDKRYRLFVQDVLSSERTVLVPYCSFVQWVPDSDVVVAQNRDSLCVWYNVDAADRVTNYPIKGDVTELVRADARTSVFVQEEGQLVAYDLDEALIEFATAMDSLDFGRAVSFLEQQEAAAETEVMWKQLAQTALQHTQLHVAKRAYAAVLDVARVQYLEETLTIARQAAEQIGGDGTQFYKVRARVAVMNRDFEGAEQVLLEQNALQEAIDMYKSLHKWDEALSLAARYDASLSAQLKEQYLQHLSQTSQNERAAELHEQDGEHLMAVELYLKAHLPARAARVVMQQNTLVNNTDLVQSIAVTLIKAELMSTAGELFEKTKDFQRALECYRKGGAFAKAVELARDAFPAEVVKLEEEWGDMLIEKKQVEAAVNHYIESGNSLKALHAAVSARQWVKAAQIADVIEDVEQAKQYLGSIAQHYASVNELERAEKFYVEAGQYREALDMYNRNARYEDAARLASTYLADEEAVSMYLSEAEQLESQGRLHEAEHLYRVVHKPNKAIAMYKAANQHEDMMRLVREFHGEHETETEVHLGRELEEQGRYAEAEGHFIKANEWKAAANMYRKAEQWDEAYRVCKSHGGEAASTQLAFTWAKHLGGDSAVKLLQKLGLLKDCIEYSSENGAFDFAFELCRLGLKSEMPAVHFKFALHLEEEEQYEEAEAQFLLAHKPKEAVLMYVHTENWNAAQRLAELHCPDMLPDVFIGQARFAFESRDYAKAESFLLRAQRPEIIVKSYKEIGMWSEALRVCRDYVPALLPKLQEEFDQQQLRRGENILTKKKKFMPALKWYCFMGAESYVAQAKEWEAQQDYDKAIVCYLKVDKPLTDDEQLMQRCWLKAGELAIKFMPEEPALDIVQQVCAQLRTIAHYTQAAEMFLSVGLVQEAIDTFIRGGEWKKAKKVASDMQPQLEAYVDEQYKAHLKNQGNTEQLVDVDAVGAIDAYIEKGQWDKALDTAQQKSPAVLNKYVALYATQLSTDNQHVQAIQVFERYGAAANAQNFNLYKRLIDQCLSMANTNTADAYSMWTNSLSSASEQLDSRYEQIFGEYLMIAHYYSMRSALLTEATNDKSARLCATRISISLLRYCTLIPADKAFYEAGVACRDFGERYEGMAFLFLNHYLDLAEAIEEQNADMVDNSVFEKTDIPTEIPLPEHLYLSSDEHEEVKEWVLAVSVDQNSDRQLLTDSRQVYEASLVNSNGSLAQPCIITGYPALDSPKVFAQNKVANRDDWNKLLLLNKTKTLPTVSDVLKFIESWTGTTIVMAV